MPIFALADTHLARAVNKPMDIFGSRWADSERKLTEGWLGTVTDGDAVVIPGDISWGISLEEALEDLKLINALPGIKYISHGNHDYWWETVSKMQRFFDDNDLSTLRLLYNNAFAVEDRIICGSRGWYTDEKTASGARIKADYEKIVNREAVRLEMSLKEAAKLQVTDSEQRTLTAFFHFPPVFGQYVCRPLVDLLHEYGVKECYYGHIHGQYELPAEFYFEDIRFTIISADYLGFTPLRIAGGRQTPARD